MSKTAKIIIAPPKIITPQVEQAMGKQIFEFLLVRKYTLVGIELDKSKGELKSALDKLVETGQIPKPITKTLPMP